MAEGNFGVLALTVVVCVFLKHRVSILNKEGEIRFISIEEMQQSNLRSLEWPWHFYSSALML
jgi:hypothetical protein